MIMYDEMGGNRYFKVITVFTGRKLEKKNTNKLPRVNPETAKYEAGVLSTELRCSVVFHSLKSSDSCTYHLLWCPVTQHMCGPYSVQYLLISFGLRSLVMWLVTFTLRPFYRSRKSSGSHWVRDQVEWHNSKQDMIPSLNPKVDESWQQTQSCPTDCTGYHRFAFL